MHLEDLPLKCRVIAIDLTIFILQWWLSFHLRKISKHRLSVWVRSHQRTSTLITVWTGSLFWTLKNRDLNPWVTRFLQQTRDTRLELAIEATLELRDPLYIPNKSALATLALLWWLVVVIIANRHPARNKDFSSYNHSNKLNRTIKTRDRCRCIFYQPNGGENGLSLLTTLTNARIWWMSSQMKVCLFLPLSS